MISRSMLQGRAGEYRVAAELLIRGHIVYEPSIEDGIDMLLDNGKAIQVKSGRKRLVQKPYEHNQYSFNIVSAKKWQKYFTRDKNKPYSIRPHLLDKVDFVILWAVEDDEFYIIPAEKVRGRTSISFTADYDKRTQVKWNKWLPYRNNWGLLNGDKLEDAVVMEECECKQCGHKWIPRVANPTRCPNCNGRWYQKMYDYTCKRCGHTWHSRVENPIVCTKCNSRIWYKEKEVNNREPITCVQCGYKWQPVVDKPERCPKCHRQRYREIFPKECKQCGHKWLSGVAISSMCPKCHSRRWNKERELVKVI